MIPDSGTEMNRREVLFTLKVFQCISTKLNALLAWVNFVLHITYIVFMKQLNCIDKLK